MKYSKMILEVSLAVSGFLILGFYVTWWAALGVFLCLWGNNIAESSRHQ